MASQMDEAFAGYQASGPVPQDEGEKRIVDPEMEAFTERKRRRGHPMARIHARTQTLLLHVPAAGATRSSRSSMPKRAVMALAMFGVVGLASVVLSRQGRAVEQHSAELSKKNSSKKGSDQGEAYGRHIYRQSVMAEFCCHWQS